MNPNHRITNPIDLDGKLPNLPTPLWVWSMLAIVAIAALLLMPGCTTAQKQWTCDNAKVAYQTYQAVISAGHKPSNDEIMAAKIAAAILGGGTWKAPHPLNFTIRTSRRMPSTSWAYQSG